MEKRQQHVGAIPPRIFEQPPHSPSELDASAILPPRDSTTHLDTPQCRVPTAAAAMIAPALDVCPTAKRVRSSRALSRVSASRAAARAKVEFVSIEA